jgi:hypothetical protein
MWRDLDREDAEAILKRRASEIAQLPWDELDRYGTRTERLRLPSGRELNVETSVFWDMEDWASDMCVSVKASREGRLRTRIYRGWDVKLADDPEDLLAHAVANRERD